jgi:hypothetical protein
MFIKCIQPWCLPIDTSVTLEFVEIKEALTEKIELDSRGSQFEFLATAAFGASAFREGIPVSRNVISSLWRRLEGTEVETLPFW